MAQGKKVILKEEKGVVLAQWGEEFVTWVRGAREDFVWGHYFCWFSWGKDKAYEYALEDYEERVKLYS